MLLRMVSLGDDEMSDNCSFEYRNVSLKDLVVRAEVTKTGKHKVNAVSLDGEDSTGDGEMKKPTYQPAKCPICRATVVVWKKG